MTGAPVPPGRRVRHEQWMRRALAVAGGPVADLPPARFPGAQRPAVDVSAASRPLTAPDVPAVDALAPDVPAVDALAPDVPVGAVVYGPDGVELAAARNERELTGDPTAHAEILALRRAAATAGRWRLDGCTLVVTLEPCTMCAGALVLARISVLVFGAWEPKTGAVGSLWDTVRDRRLTHRAEVYAGVLEPECAALLRGFFGRPGP